MTDATTRATVSLVSHGARETERLLMEADGFALMRNADGSLTFDIYSDKKRNAYRIRVPYEECRIHRDAIRDWARDRLNSS